MSLATVEQPASAMAVQTQTFFISAPPKPEVIGR